MTRPPNISRGRCRTCKALIWWAQKPDGGWHRPLEQYEPESLLVRIDSDGVARLMEGPVFVSHVCNPEEIEKAQAEITEWNRTHVPNSSTLFTEVEIACPRCGAEIGELCRPLDPEKYAKAAGTKGRTHLVTVHEARRERRTND